MKTFTLVILILKNVQRPKRQPLENGNLMTAEKDHLKYQHKKKQILQQMKNGI